jgi:hypothetical protein
MNLTDIALQGGRYQVAFAPTSRTVTINTQTRRDFEYYIKHRTGMKNIGFGQLGRVFTVNFDATESRSLLSIVGGPVQTENAVLVASAASLLKAKASTAARVVGALNPVNDFKAGYNTGQKIGEKITSAAGNAVESVGGALGGGIAELLKPLVPFALLTIGAMYLLNQQPRRRAR